MTSRDDVAVTDIDEQQGSVSPALDETLRDAAMTVGFGEATVRQGRKRKELTSEEVKEEEDKKLQGSGYVAKAHVFFMNRMETIFNKFDADGSGTIDRDELQEVLLSMGYALTDEQLDELLGQVDVDGNGCLDLDEFTTLVKLWMEAAQYKIFDQVDSISAEHINESRQQKVRAFLPDITWRWYWDTSFFLIVTYFWIVTLTFHAYEDDQDKEKFDRALIPSDIIFSLLLLAHVVMEFLTAYRDGHSLVDDKKEIALHYLQTWFVFDLITMLPINYLMTNIQAIVISRHLRLLLVLRLPTLFKSSGMMSITTKFITFHYSFLPYCQGFCIFITVIYAIAMIHQAFVRAAFDAGLASASEKRFSACMYWTMYVVAGVGYGDMAPYQDAHRWFASFLFVFSMIVNGLFVGSMVNLMQEADVESSRRSRLVQMQVVLRFFEVPEALAEEILQFQDHILGRVVSSSYQALVDMLPPEMRQNIFMQSRVPLLSGCKIFHKTHVSTIVQIAECLVPMYTPPEHYVAVSGASCDYFVVINYGFIDVISGVGTYVVTLKRGDYFGEMALLDKEETAHSYSYKAINYCDLFTLKATSMMLLETKFPKFAQDMAKEFEMAQTVEDPILRLAKLQAEITKEPLNMEELIRRKMEDVVEARRNSEVLGLAPGMNGIIPTPTDATTTASNNAVEVLELNENSGSLGSNFAALGPSRQGVALFTRTGSTVHGNLAAQGSVDPITDKITEADVEELRAMIEEETEIIAELMDKLGHQQA